MVHTSRHRFSMSKGAKGARVGACWTDLGVGLGGWWGISPPPNLCTLPPSVPLHGLPDLLHEIMYYAWCALFLPYREEC
jgi:hypothetical protein